MPARRAPERGRLWPALAAIAGIALAVALGNWQLGRAAEKRELKERMQARANAPPLQVPASELAPGEVELRRVEARGVFEPRYAVYIDNRMHRGVPGYHVVMPLRIGGSERYVLVNRGWIARGALRSRLPHVDTPAEPVSISGVAKVPRQRTLELSDAVIEGRIWQNLTIERYRDAMPIAIQPFIIEQTSALDDGLVREWEAPDLGIEKHYGYAFQWYALAATLLIFYAVTQFRRAGTP